MAEEKWPESMTNTRTGRGLGRGLSALLGDDQALAETEAAATGGPLKPRSLPIAFLKPNQFQPVFTNCQ